MSDKFTNYFMSEQFDLDAARSVKTAIENNELAAETAKSGTVAGLDNKSVTSGGMRNLCVTRMDHQKLDFLIGFFLHECPSSMIPSKAEVLEWAEALEAREGAEFTAHAAACRSWLV